jgi:hypothetical protein
MTRTAANVVDLTVQCPNLIKGGVGVFSVFAEPTGNPPIESGKIKPLLPGRPATPSSSSDSRGSERPAEARTSRRSSDRRRTELTAWDSPSCDFTQ